MIAFPVLGCANPSERSPYTPYIVYDVDVTAKISDVADAAADDDATTVGADAYSAAGIILFVFY